MTKPTSFSIGLGSVVSIITIVATVLVSYFTAGAAVADKISEVKGDVKVLQDARSNVEKTLDELSVKTDRIPYIEGKLDQALRNLGGNPQVIERNVTNKMLSASNTLPVIQN